jgi:hypothetical protein
VTATIEQKTEAQYRPDNQKKSKKKRKNTALTKKVVLLQIKTKRH